MKIYLKKFILYLLTYSILTLNLFQYSFIFCIFIKIFIKILEQLPITYSSN